MNHPGKERKQREFDSKVEHWLIDMPSRRVRAGRWIAANYYKLKFRRMKRPHWATALNHLVKAALAASGPFIAWIAFKTINGAQAAGATAILFPLVYISSFLDRYTASVAKPKASASLLEITRKFGDLASYLQPVPHTNGHAAIRSCLSIIEAYARNLTGSEIGEISVSLVMYCGQSRSKMRIDHRSGNDRPVGRVFPVHHLLGHHACAAGADPRTVHNLAGFGELATKSPTGARPSYRSFYILPIYRAGTDKAQSSPEGYLSIDSPRPYAFYGNHAKVLTVDLEPIFDHVSQLI